MVPQNPDLERMFAANLKFRVNLDYFLILPGGGRLFAGSGTGSGNPREVATLITGVFRFHRVYYELVT